MTLTRNGIAPVVDVYLGHYPDDAERLAPFLESIAGGGDLV